MRAVLATRRGGWITFGVLLVAVLTAIAFVTFQITSRASVEGLSPAPGSAVADRGPTVAFSLDNADRIGDLTILLDGEDVTDAARVASGVVSVPTKGLDQGRHRVEVELSNRNIFSTSSRRQWSFTVDTTRPALAVGAPGRGALQARRRVPFGGRAEPGSTVVVAWEGGRVRVGAPTGRWRAVARLPEGRSDVRVTARDAAGNTRSIDRRVVVDTTAPALVLSGPPGGARVTETDAPLLYGALPKDRPEALVFGGAINGRPFTAVRGADAPTVEEAAFAEEVPRIALDGRRFALSVGTLPEGTSTVRMWARDPAGNIATATTKVNVNSTDIFGGSTLVRGARGEDIAVLHGRLALAEVYKGRPREVFDKRTEGAVRRYQKRYRLPITGRVDPATRDAMVGRIIVNLTQKKLRLVRDGRVAKTYPVAIGTTAHPSPVGSFTVTDLQRNPAWFPPDSPWAAGLGPIPPGPGNPLGTRWIGTSSPAIGIHGTYADETIGTAASHGCIRMHIPDVEELFDQVAVGMDVEFRV